MHQRPNIMGYMNIGFSSKTLSHLVLGTPFIQDLIAKTPTRKLFIEFPSKVENEQVFEIFRPYGKISSITIEDTKVTVLFWMESSATCAKNCLHHSNYENIGTIKISYKEFHRFQAFYDLFHNPRMVLIFLLNFFSYQSSLLLSC
jgi:hypothetical protein